MTLLKFLLLCTNYDFCHIQLDREGHTLCGTVDSILEFFDPIILSREIEFITIDKSYFVVLLKELTK